MENRPNNAVGPERRFRVAAFVRGSGFGRLTVSRETITFDPGPITRHLLGLRGSLVHRAERVVVVESPLMALGVHVVLRAIRTDGLVRSPLLSRRMRDVSYAILSIYPWQTRRVLSAIRSAGFDVQLRRRWFYFGMAPVD